MGAQGRCQWWLYKRGGDRALARRFGNGYARSNRAGDERKVDNDEPRERPAVPDRQPRPALRGAPRTASKSLFRLGSRSQSPQIAFVIFSRRPLSKHHNEICSLSRRGHLASLGPFGRWRDRLPVHQLAARRRDAGTIALSKDGRHVSTAVKQSHSKSRSWTRNSATKLLVQ
jgi:hypothetical protein